MQKLNSIRNLQRLGFTLKEIRDLYDEESHTPSVEQLTENIKETERPLQLLMISIVEKMFPRPYRPTPSIVRAPARAKSLLTCTITNTLTIKQRKSGQGVLKLLQIHMILRHLGQV